MPDYHANDEEEEPQQQVGRAVPYAEATAAFGKMSNLGTSRVRHFAVPKLRNLESVIINLDSF